METTTAFLCCNLSCFREPIPPLLRDGSLFLENIWFQSLHPKVQLVGPADTQGGSLTPEEPRDPSTMSLP